MHLLRRVMTRAGDAFRCVRAAQHRHGAGLPGTIVRFADLYGRRRYSIAEIETLDLLDPSLTRSALDRRQSKEAQLEMQMRLNPRDCWPRTEHKLEFERYCNSHGLAVPRSFGVFAVARESAAGNREARAEAVRCLASAPALDLIVKPVDGVYGLGVCRLVRSDGGFLCHDGRLRSVEAVYDWVAASSEFARYLVQERIGPHPELARLSGGDALQTVRMVTYVASDGRVTIGNCQLRVVVGDTPVDNFFGGRTGNLICDIPNAGGIVARGCGRAEGGRGLVTVARHPRTGIAFEGFRVPCWDAACRLVRDAATAFLPLRTIGWDVAITEGEPVLIEGNVTWDPAYEGVVGGEILDAVLRDAQRSKPAATLRSAVTG